MDSTAIIFYAVICGFLGLFAPNFGGAPVRLGIGALVGVVAALALPMIRTVFDI
jgi:hypothetical protein